MRIVLSASDGNSLIRFRGNLIQSMVACGHEVICLSGEPEEEMAPRLSPLGASYRRVPLSRTGTSPVEDFKTLLAYRRLLRELRPDVYFGYMSKPVAYGGTAARLCRVPHIHILVTGLEIAFYSTGLKHAVVRFVLKRFFKFAHKRAETVFFQNPDDYEAFLRMRLVTRQQSVLVNGSGVDMAEFPRQPLPDSPVFLMVARLVWSKGIREYLYAAQKLKAACPDASCLLVGGLDTNPESLTREELEQAVKGSGLVYCGQTDDVRPYLRRCSVFVLPSYHEGTPRSVLEAMSTGRAIITTDAPGCRETVRDGYNGLLVPVKDGESLYLAMNRLARDDALRQEMAVHSWELCREKYEVGLVNETMLRAMKLNKEEESS